MEGEWSALTRACAERNRLLDELRLAEAREFFTVSVLVVVLLTAVSVVGAHRARAGFDSGPHDPSVVYNVLLTPRMDSAWDVVWWSWLLGTLFFAWDVLLTEKKVDGMRRCSARGLAGS